MLTPLASQHPGPTPPWPSRACSFSPPMGRWEEDTLPPPSPLHSLHPQWQDADSNKRWGPCELRGENLDQEAALGIPCPGRTVQVSAQSYSTPEPLLDHNHLHRRPPRNPFFPIGPLLFLILHSAPQTPSQSALRLSLGCTGLWGRCWARWGWARSQLWALGWGMLLHFCLHGLPRRRFAFTRI